MMKQQKTTVEILLMACAVVLAALAPLSVEARKELTAEAPAPCLPPFPFSMCTVTDDCASKIAIGILTHTKVTDLECCRLIIENGEKCFDLALEYYTYAEHNHNILEVHRWGDAAWSHCLSIRAIEEPDRSIGYGELAMGKPHAVVIPYPAQGHVIPLMELSHCLVNHGFKITFINTEFNHKRVMDSLSSGDNDGKEFPIRLISIPDGLGLEEDRNDLGKLTTAIITLMPGMLEEVIRKINEEAEGGENGDVVTCVVADENMGWALEVAEKMGLQRAAFCPTAAAIMAQALIIPKLIEDGFIDDEGTPMKNHVIKLSANMPTTNTEKLSWNCFGDPATNKVLFNYIHNNTRIAQAMDWIICNSSFELEPDAFTLFPKILPIGPLLASSRLERSSGHFWPMDSTCLNWLNQQPSRSVIYVAFGSFTVFEETQFQELAFGLELSGKRFLWVTRPDSSHSYPDGFQTRISTRGGLIVGWAPQQNVLSHPSVACFISHCGWNSTMEGVINGIPFLCWPYFGDQFLNQDYICDIWKIGLRLSKNENGIISRKEIMEKVKQVTEDEGIRTRGLKLMEMAKESVKDGGSSSKNFKDFIERIK